MNALFLAFANLRWHWARSLVLVLIGAVILAVPLVTQTILRGSQDALTARAEATPLVLGARGSALDLVMGSIYFSDARATAVTRAAEDTVWDSGLALPIPVLTAFQTSGARIVGTSLDYLDFRDLTLAEGRPFAVLGEVVLGAAVAERLGLAPGDTLVSSPQSLFDLDGVYPLEMTVAGILAPSGTPDDEAVFADVKTTWIIAGIGHGHDDVVSADEAGRATANAAIEQFTRITPDNLDSFHFHGDGADYPLSAVLLVPYDDRSATILRGRYLDDENPLQIVVPRAVVGELVDRVFRIAAALDAVSVVIGLAAAGAMGLALFLSWQLRAPEVATARALGAGRGVILRLAAAEITILLLVALQLSFVMAVIVHANGDRLVGWLLAL